MVSDYQNKVLLGERNLVIIDLKTGKVKLYQLCVYAVRNNCPVIIVELYSGDVHLLTPEAAAQILSNIPLELEKISKLRSFNATLPGQDCKFCGKECKDRKVEHSPYKVSTTDFEERALQLETNYTFVKEKVQKLIQYLMQQEKVTAAAEVKEEQKVTIAETSKEAVATA